MDDLIRRSDALNCSKIVYIEYLETDDGWYTEGEADYIPVVKKRGIEAISAVDAVPWEFLERYADWFCAAVSAPEFVREAKSFYKSTCAAMNGGVIDQRREDDADGG